MILESRKTSIRSIIKISAAFSLSSAAAVKVSTRLSRKLTPGFHPCHKAEGFDLHPQPRPEIQPAGRVPQTPPFPPSVHGSPIDLGKVQKLWYRSTSSLPSIICRPILLLAHSGARQLLPPSCYIWRERLLAYRLPLP